MPPESNIPAPELKKINFKKPPAHIVVLIVFAIVLGVLQIYLLKNPDLLQNTYPSVLDKNVLDKKNLTVDPISDWKTYRNEDFEFEFKYPNNGWEIEITDTTSLTIVKTEDLEYSYSGLTLAIKEDVQSFIDKYNPKDAGEKITINDIDWIKVNSENPNQSSEVKNYNFIYSIKNGRLYLFSYTAFRTEYDQILSTFKFISTSTTDMASPDNWGVHHNSNTLEDFEFKYPPEASLTGGSRGIRLFMPREKIDIEIYMVGEFNRYPECYSTEEVKAKKLIGLHEWTSCDTGWTTKTPKNNLLVIEVISPNALLSEEQKILIEDILSTFKFFSPSAPQY